MSFDELKKQILHLAKGQWSRIYSEFGYKIPSQSKGIPCPKCGGSDRFHLLAASDKTGVVQCRQCLESQKHADGIGSVSWLLGIGNTEAAKRIATVLGIDFMKKEKARNQSDSKSKFRFEAFDPGKITPARREQISRLIRERFLCANPGITKEGLKRSGVTFGRFQPSRQHPNKGDMVLAFPFRNLKGSFNRFVMMLINGKEFQFYDDKKKKLSTSKIENCVGYCGSLEGNTVFITEGETDLAALNSVLPGDNRYSAITLGGATVKPNAWMAKTLSSKSNVIFVFDNDESGKIGVQNFVRTLASFEPTVSYRIVNLDGLDEGETDFRDWIQKDGNNFDRLLELAAKSEQKRTCEWGEIENFENDDLPIFPTNVLPSPLKEWVVAESHATQTPADLCALLSLAVCAAAIARRVEVEPRPGWKLA